MNANVCLTISSYRNDDAVEALLKSAVPLVPRLFSRIIVVDSLGTGRVSELVRARGWDAVHYESAPQNLGSAGNLARRLELAAATGADFAYALNHDGALSETAVSALVDAARSVSNLGAAYPLRVLTNQRRRYDLTGASRLLRPRLARVQEPEQEILDVYWGSSNGTLYALAPIRAGLGPWSDLWMGWEDLGYGLLLYSRGYRQVIVRSATFDDPYEFRSVSSTGERVYVTDKPSWYTYYSIRNLILIGRRLDLRWDERVSFGARIALEGGAILALRRNKRERLRLFARGLVDGMLSRTGKRP